MTPMTVEEIDNHDKRVAAVHEAGHLTVAVVSGCRASAWIGPSGTLDPFAEKLWIGQTQHRPPRTANDAALGVAGAVAEIMDVDALDPSDIAILIESDETALSETDRQSLGDADLLEAVNAAVAILYQHADFHEWVVAELLEHESIATGALAIGSTGLSGRNRWTWRSDHPYTRGHMPTTQTRRSWRPWKAPVCEAQQG